MRFSVTSLVLALTVAAGMAAGGQRLRVQLDQAQGERPGLILAAITIRYATPSQFEELRKGD